VATPSKAKQRLTALLAAYETPRKRSPAATPAPRKTPKSPTPRPPTTTSRPSYSDPQDLTNRPLASHGLTSYRYRGHYGWVMIGARNDEEALREAQRSVHEATTIDKLQVWNNTEYVPATSRRAPSPKKTTPPRTKASSVFGKFAVPGLMWSTLRGTPVLALKSSGPDNFEDSEFVAYVPDHDHPHAFNIIDLRTQKSAGRGYDRSAVLETILGLTRQRQAEDRERELVEQAKRGVESVPDTRALYLVAPQTSPKEPLANYDLDNHENALADAYDTFRKYPKERPLLLIEATGNEAAMSGDGHVWWIDGMFKGPPVDPRQTGFGW